MNSYETFHDLWIHIWIHTDIYEEYCEIIPEIMWTKVPDVATTGKNVKIFKELLG